MPQTLTAPPSVDLPPVVNGERMSFEEFLERADDRHMEWVDGEVLLLGAASNWHQDLADFLTALLRHYVEEYDLGSVRSAPTLMKTGARLSGREPDVVFLSREHLLRRRDTYIDGPADLAIEIISPESERRDTQDKYREYEQGGVAEYWLIDPLNHRAWFYNLENGRYRAADVGEDGIYHSVVLPGLWLNQNWLWQQELPKLRDVLREWGLI